MTRYAYTILFGWWFGVIQSSYFFQLEIFLTAAYTGFITATLAWIAGSIAGLYLARPANGSPPLIIWHAAGLAAYYTCLLSLAAFPYQLALTPLYFILIMVSGGQTGHFFAYNQKTFPKASTLFFMENNGFILGWLVGFSGFVMAGVDFHYYFPLVAGTALVPLALYHGKKMKGQKP